MPCAATGRIFFGAHDGLLHVLDVERRLRLGQIDPFTAVHHIGSTVSAPGAPERAIGQLGPIAGPVAISASGQQCYLATLRSHVVAIQLPPPGGGRGGSSERVSGLWQRKLPRPVFAGPVLAANETLLLVSSVDHCLYGLECSDGRTRWTVTTGAPLFGSPSVLFGEGLTTYGPGQQHAGDVAVLGSNDDLVRHVAIDTGRVLSFSEACGAHIVASPAAVLDGCTLVASVDGAVRLYNIKDDGRDDKRGSSQGPAPLVALETLRLDGPIFSSPTLVAAPACATPESDGDPLPQLCVVGCRDDHLYGIEVALRPPE